jgi:hypothetical protein
MTDRINEALRKAGLEDRVQAKFKVEPTKFEYASSYFGETIATTEANLKTVTTTRMRGDRVISTTYADHVDDAHLPTVSKEGSWYKKSFRDAIRGIRA